MKIFLHIIWALTGTGLAFLFLIMQRWTAMIINPEHPHRSQLLVIGGAFIRWILIFFVLMLALSYSLPAMFMAFSLFMITRLYLLLKWQRLLFASGNQFHKN
jgi:hypothetical protein